MARVHPLAGVLLSADATREERGENVGREVLVLVPSGSRTHTNTRENMVLRCREMCVCIYLRVVVSVDGWIQ